MAISAQSLAQELELRLRLVLAVLLGGLLGVERELGRHAAGLRTHVLVTLGAAAYTIARRSTVRAGLLILL